MWNLFWVGEFPWKRDRLPTPVFLGFPGGSDGKESACNAGDSGSIPGSGRSAGEGIGYPLQYSWASLVAQLVKNLPAVWEAWVWSPHWDDPLEKGRATHSSVLAWRIPWAIQSMGSQRVGHNWATFTFRSFHGSVDNSNLYCFVFQPVYWIPFFKNSSVIFSGIHEVSAKTALEDYK